MNRQQAFENHWATVHEVPVESMEQYRWKNKDGYRLPDMAAAYRNFCAGWELHESKNGQGFTRVDMANAARDERNGISESLIERLAIAYPDSETTMTVECFADWLSKEFRA